MLVLELFSGTGVVGDAFARRGHRVFGVDWDKSTPADMHRDILQLSADEVVAEVGYPDVVWASPDCTTYSVAAISRHRRKVDGVFEPVSEYAAYCDEVNRHVMRLIAELDPPLWFIENPRAVMRKMPWLEGLPRYTVTYCQYGEKFMKPTDIWTNHPDPRFKPPCRNGDPCHVSSPRGTRTGLQGLAKGNRSRIPLELCEHVADICEEVVYG